MPRRPTLDRWTALLIAVLAGAAALHVAHLGRPLLGMHSWRMTHNAMVARNYVEHGLEPTRTLVDFGG